MLAVSLSSLGLVTLGLLSGCVSSYSVDKQTQEVTVTLPANTQNNPEITALKSSLRETYRHTKIGVIQMGDELFVSYPSDQLFGVGNTQLLAHSQIYLDMLLGQVKSYGDLAYMVEGFTDSSGSQKGNLMLSEKRAQSVADYLESQGVSADNIIVKGYGGLYPVAANDTKQSRAKNRRVVITIVTDKADFGSPVAADKEADSPVN